MNRILSPEDKKYLKFFSKYLLSYGEHTATFRIEDWSPDHPYIPDQPKIEENYYLEIPIRVNSILNKISDVCGEYEPSYESDDIGSTWTNFIINPDEQSIFAEFCYSYYTRDEQGMSWGKGDVKEDDHLKNVFNILYEENIPWIRVAFDGSGDSGSIEQGEDKNGRSISIPSDVEDWCYGVLESHFGGWEINEGSSGYFVFDVTKKQVNLEFGWNNENTECDTIYEEKFG
jgi:hypothetical protein